MVQHVEFRRKWDSLGPSVECPTGCLSEGYLLTINQSRPQLGTFVHWFAGSRRLADISSHAITFWSAVLAGVATNHHCPRTSMMTRMICTPYRLDLTSVPRPPAGNNSLVSGCWIVEQGKPPNPFPALSLLSSRLHEMKFWPSRERWSFSLPLQLGTLSCKFQPWIGMRIDCL